MFYDYDDWCTLSTYFIYSMFTFIMYMGCSHRLGYVGNDVSLAMTRCGALHSTEQDQWLVNAETGQQITYYNYHKSVEKAHKYV